MEMQLFDLFTSMHNLRDKAIDDDKLQLLFTASCDFYFSRVNPIKDMTDPANCEEDPFVKDSFIPKLNIIIVDEVYTLNDPKIKRCRTLPMDYMDYTLSISYFASFKEVVNFFLEEEEKDNFQLLEQVGAELTIDITNEAFTELRSVLDESFDIETTIIIIDGVEVVL